MTLMSVLRLGRAPRKLDAPRNIGPGYKAENLNGESLSEISDFFPSKFFIH